MEASSNPIKTENLISLEEVKIPASLIKFKRISLQPEKLICVRSDEKITIVDVNTKKVADLKTKVDSVILNKYKNIVGLQAGSNIQVFDLSKKVKLNSTIFDFTIQYWCWVDINTIALVTEDSVYHWSIPGESDPEPVFNREPYEGKLQIINYKTSGDGNWMMLSGIAAGPEGKIIGHLQLYSKPRQRSQIFRNSHTGCFATVTLEGHSSPSGLFCFTSRSGEDTKLSVVEIAAEKSKAFRSMADLGNFEASDFPVAMVADEKHSMLFVINKSGFLNLSDIETGIIVFRIQTGIPVFIVEPHEPTGGVVMLGPDGVARRHSVDGTMLVKHVKDVKKDPGMATKLCIRLGLDADDNLYIEHFDKLIEERNIVSATQIVIKAPRELLRTPETVEKFRSIDAKPGRPSPLLQYFSQLLKHSPLKDFESIELIKPVIRFENETAKRHIEEWIRGEKLAFSEELGDLLLPFDAKLACSVYLRAHCVSKAIDCFMLLGHFSKIPAYAERENFEIDWTQMLTRLHQLDAKKSKNFALQLIEENRLSLMEVTRVFLNAKDFKVTTSFLLDSFKRRGDLKEDGQLQTLLLSLNIENAPRVAEAIMDSDEFKLTQYDHQKIARICEGSELYSKALENYSDIEDIKRCLKAGLATEKIEREFVLNFFERITAEEGLECIGDLLEFDSDSFLGLTIEIANRYSEKLSNEALINIFESTGNPSAVYRFLGQTVNTTKEPQIVLKYIEAAAEANEIRELLRICKTNDIYNPDEVKNFLFERDLEDPRPLISVCDRFDYIEEMAAHLYEKNMLEFVTAYVQKVNPKATSKVFLALFEAGASRKQLQGLLRDLYPKDLGDDFMKLVSEMQKKDCKPILLPWLERCVEEGCKLPDVHNVLGSIYVESNNNPNEFLEKNSYYDPKFIGKICEKHDLKLAMKVYSRIQGNCDEDFIRVGICGGFYAELAQFLVSRQDESLWTLALSNEDDHRRSLVAQVVKTLGKSKKPEEVSVTVKAFIAADLPKELIELLERLVFDGVDDEGLKSNRNLQNLLILTAIKADPDRVMGYISRLSDFDGPDIAKIAVSSGYKLYEEALEIYLRFGRNKEAIEIIIEDLEDIDRAKEFSEKVNNRQIWEILGKEQLRRGNFEDAVESFMKGKNFHHCSELVNVAEKTDENWVDLVRYLEAAPRANKTTKQLIFAYAKVNNLDGLKNFIKENNVGKIDEVGGRCMEEDLYDAAQIIYEYTNNYNRLALCCINLLNFEKAVRAAEKAKSVQTWKAVCYASVDAGKFGLAEFCAARVIGNAEQLRELVNHYEQNGNFKEVVAVLEKGICQERAHSGLFTELGVLYCKYCPEKLMSHLNAFTGRVNVRELIKTCLEFNRWKEAMFLYKENGEFEKAVEVALEHSPSCFDPAEFLVIVREISRNDLLFKVVSFYEEMHPLRLNEILKELKNKLDDNSIVKMFKKKRMLPLVFEYLQSIQSRNKRCINEYINELLLEEEDIKGLENSITKNDNFNHEALAKTLSKHPLKKFRKLASVLMNKCKNYKKSMLILKNDGSYDEMIQTARISKNAAMAEELVRFFVKCGSRRHLAVSLLELRSLLRTHIIVEVAWLHGMTELAMPFVLQAVANFENRVLSLEARAAEQEKQKLENGKKTINERKKIGSDQVLAIMGSTSKRALDGNIDGNEL